MLWDDEPLNLRPVDPVEGQALILQPDRDEGLAELIDGLALAGFDVARIADADALIESIERHRPDLIVVPSLAPKAAVTALLDRIEAACTSEKLPVLLVADQPIDWSGRHAVCDTIAPGTNLAGVFLSARALVRRVRPWALSAVRTYGALHLSQTDFKITYHGQAVALGRLDFNMLGPFFDAPEHVFDRATLQRLASGGMGRGEGQRLIDVRISATRALLKGALQFDPIMTVRGVGYQLAKVI